MFFFVARGRIIMYSFSLFFQQNIFRHSIVPIVPDDLLIEPEADRDVPQRNHRQQAPINLAAQAQQQLQQQQQQQRQQQQRQQLQQQQAATDFFCRVKPPYNVGVNPVQLQAYFTNMGRIAGMEQIQGVDGCFFITMSDPQSVGRILARNMHQIGHLQVVVATRGNQTPDRIRAAMAAEAQAQANPPPLLTQAHLLQMQQQQVGHPPPGPIYQQVQQPLNNVMPPAPAMGGVPGHLQNMHMHQQNMHMHQQNMQQMQAQFQNPIQQQHHQHAWQHQRAHHAHQQQNQQHGQPQHPPRGNGNGFGPRR